VQTTLADAAFLAALERECLMPERFRRAVEHAMARVREELAKDPDRGPTLEKERAGLGRKIARMVVAIGDGAGPKALVDEIKKAEERIAEIAAELARLAAGPALAAVDLGRIEEAVAEQLRRFAGLLQGNVPRARQLLKKLLADRVEFSPVDAGDGRRAYAFTGQLSYGAAIREIIFATGSRGGPCLFQSSRLPTSRHGSADPFIDFRVSTLEADLRERVRDRGAVPGAIRGETS
jgi:hypothetical protein